MSHSCYSAGWTEKVFSGKHTGLGLGPEFNFMGKLLVAGEIYLPLSFCVSEW
jgi:hypothetical protein